MMFDLNKAATYYLLLMTWVNGFWKEMLIKLKTEILSEKHFV